MTGHMSEEEDGSTARVDIAILLVPQIACLDTYAARLKPWCAELKLSCRIYFKRIADSMNTEKSENSNSSGTSVAATPPAAPNIGNVRDVYLILEARQASLDTFMARLKVGGQIKLRRISIS